MAGAPPKMDGTHAEQCIKVEDHCICETAPPASFRQSVSQAPGDRPPFVDELPLIGRD